MNAFPHEVNGSLERQAAFLLTAAIGLALPHAAAAQSSPSPFTSAVRYDANGRVAGTIAPDPDGGGPLAHAATRTTYDAAGRPIRVEKGELSTWQSEEVAPASWSGFTMLLAVDTGYDLMDRKLTELTRGSDWTPVSLTQYSYDGLGRVQCTARRMNPAAYGGLPASACTLGPEGDFGPDRITRNAYDSASQLLSVENAVGTPLARVEARYTYSPNGKRTSLTDARGYMATMSYDGYDRLAQWNLPSPTTPGVASSTDYESYGYDANDNRTSLRKRDGSVLGFQYDALNRVTLKIVPERAGLSPTHTRDVHYGYDLRGLQTYARFDGPGGEGVTNGWDGFGRQLSSQLAMDGQVRVLNSRHDANGNRTQMIYPDGGSNITYAYDGLNRSVAMFENGASQLTNVTYDRRGTPGAFSRRMGDHTLASYDTIGRLSSYTHNFVAGTGNVTTSLGYTPSSQVAQQARSNASYAWTGHAALDLSYATNGLNQYTGVGPNPYSYDANGSLTSDGLTSYQYDVENRLVGVSGQNTAQLRYDPLGRLYETVAYNGAVTRFLYDNDELVAEYGGGGEVLRQYVHGSGADDPLVWYEGPSFGAAAARYLYTDHQGSVIAISGANGANQTINSYDEYGIPGGGNEGRFQYTGQAWLKEVGLYHYKARVYSPRIGRFLQTDPIGYGDQINLYAYVANDPVDGTDPSGELKCEGKRCDEVNAAAATAKERFTITATALRGLAAAVKSHATLSASQASLSGTFEKKFGAGSATASGLNSTANTFDSAAAKIGTPGTGATVTFGGPSATAAATAGVGGNSMTVYDSFFTAGTAYKAFIIGHEGGHLAGLKDMALPASAPAGMGYRSLGAMRAYGKIATDWLGEHAPSIARSNNDSHICLSLQCYP